MKIIVCIKQADSIGDEIEFTADQSAIAPELLEGALNEWDGAALEEAVLTKERVDPTAEIIATSVGSDRVEPALRECLAKGADRAIRIDGLERTDPLAVANALAAVARTENPDLVFCGVQSSDWAQAATGSAMAGFLDFPLVAVTRQFKIDPSTRTAEATRELDGGMLDVVVADLPAVFTIQTGINAPRYATLRAIKQAEKRELEVVNAAEAPSFGNWQRRMYVPAKTAGAHMLGTDAAQVAARVIDIIRSALK